MEWPSSGSFDATIAALDLPVVAVDSELALDAAEFRELASSKGLSQADCICLALAKRLGAPALTADRQWLKVAEAIGVEVQLIRELRSVRHREDSEAKLRR